MKKTQKRTKRHYPEDFKQQAINLAKEIGTKETAEKLGIEKVQTLTAWVRYSKKIEENTEFKELEEARKEIKRLKKELDIEKESVAILKDAAAFFCQDHLK